MTPMPRKRIAMIGGSGFASMAHDLMEAGILRLDERIVSDIEVIPRRKKKAATKTDPNQGLPLSRQQRRLIERNRRKGRK